MSIGQYLRDTQAELKHVAWPTRLQTIVYTVLVALLSVVVALYLGVFDYVFTSGLARFLEVLPSAAPIIEMQNLDSTSTPAIQVSPADVSEVPSAAPAPSLEDALKVN